MVCARDYHLQYSLLALPRKRLQHLCFAASSDTFQLAHFGPWMRADMHANAFE